MHHTVRLGAIVTLLLALLVPASVFAESEPNDATADAIGIGYANAEVNATLYNNSDVDYYKFTAIKNNTYVIETYDVGGTPGSQATGLWLYNASGGEIDHDGSGVDGTGNANARIVFTFVNAGTFYIKVARRNFSSWAGTYSLRVLPRYGQGATWDASNDYEPNDVPELANALSVGPAGAQTHQIFDHANFVTSDGDQDYYRFDAVAGRTYVIQTFNVQTDTNGNGTSIYLYNSSGTELKNDRTGSNGVGSVDGQVTFTFSNSDTYFIKVLRRIFITWTGTYSIRVCERSCTRAVYVPLVKR
jgi:hypothetical protein